MTAIILFEIIIRYCLLFTDIKKDDKLNYSGPVPL